MPALLAVPPSLKAVETEPAVHEDAPPRLVEFRCMHYRPVEIQHMDFAAEYLWRIHSYGHSLFAGPARGMPALTGASACLLVS